MLYETKIVRMLYETKIGKMYRSQFFRPETNFVENINPNKDTGIEKKVGVGDLMNFGER